MALQELVTRALGGVTVDVESNVTPPIRAFDSSDTGPSILDLLGVKTRLVVRSVDGRPIAEYGEPLRTNYALAGFLVLVGVAALIVLGAGVGRLIR